MNSQPDREERERRGIPGSPVKGLLAWLLLLLAFIFLFQSFSRTQERSRQIPFNPDFVELVEQGKVRRCVIVNELSGMQYIRGELVETDPHTGRPKQFRVDLVMTDDLPRWLREHGVAFEYRTQNPYVWQIVSGAIPFLLFAALLYFLFVRQMRIAGKGALSFGKSRARLLTRDRNQVTFNDVAGIEEAKEEVQEIIEFLKDPPKFQRLGGRIPKGVLLIGPPGTGKTLLAKAIAGEANVPFFSISGSDFVEMFVGVGASRVRDMFEQARRNAPCLVFIDEIDAVGRSRFTGIGGGHDEREQTLNALLVEMDGFDTKEGVIIIAATNRPDVLDPALLRPGRFDRQIVVDLPSLEGREAILRLHAKKLKLAPDADLRRIARGTPGFSGADLANLINEAALLAARRGAEAVEMQDLEEARDKVRWGRERRSRVLDEEEKRLTAYHEAGHAVVMVLLEDTEPLHKVSIIPRGVSLGATMQLPEKDRYTESRSRLMAVITSLMGGRAAEELVFNDITTGAQADLRQATQIARRMVCEWGMSEELGPRSFGEREELLFLGREISRTQEFSEATARKIDEEVDRILRAGYRKARAILEDHLEQLHAVARALLEKESLEGKEIEEIIFRGQLSGEGSQPAPQEREKSGAPVTEPEKGPEAKQQEGRAG